MPKGNEQPEEHSTIIYISTSRKVVRLKVGSLNCVPSDTALEQTYNRDVKESASGFTEITLVAKARPKWLYTKLVT